MNAFWFLGAIAFAYGMFLLGKRAGRREERERCHGLCHQAVLKRWSGTTRWVMNAIWSGRATLLPPDEFFSAKTVHEESSGEPIAKWYVCEVLLVSGRSMTIKMPYDQTPAEAADVAAELVELAGVVKRWEAGPCSS